MYTDSHPISFKFNARYYVLGRPGPKIKQVWIVCHGYGQLAQFFIQKFKLLDNGQNLIIAPEGLSRFYLQGFSGKVGATWMTKEDRATDIENYLNYLNQLVSEIFPALDDQAQITFLGFSQGAETISRFAVQTPLEIDRLILWAGKFPKDLDIPSARQKLAKVETFLIYGKQDSLINGEVVEEQETLSKTLGLNPNIVLFEGGHMIDEEILKKFL